MLLLATIRYITTKRHGPHCALLSWPNLTTLHCTLNDCYVNSDLFVCKKNRNGFPNSSIDLISSPVRALGCTSSICNFMYNLFKSFLKENFSFHEPAFLQKIHTIEIKKSQAQSDWCKMQMEFPSARWCREFLETTQSNASDVNPPGGDTNPPGGDNPWNLLFFLSILKPRPQL